MTRLLLLMPMLGALSCVRAEPESPEEVEHIGDDDAGDDDESPPEQVPGSDWECTPEHVFSDDVVHEIRIELPDESAEALLDESREYQVADFEHDGHRWVDVGVRLKGNVCWRPLTEKAAFKVKFDFEHEPQRFCGLNRITLNNLVYDPSMAHEYLAYHAYREAGLPASRVGYANVTVNNEPYGLYAIVETLDEDFVQGWWDDPSGAVYESGSFKYHCDLDEDCTCFQINEPGEGDSLGDLLDLCEQATVEDDDAFFATMDELMDWERFLDAMALEVVLGHWDSYSSNVNNFHLYHEPTLHQWFFVPWSTDLAWGWNPWGADYTCGDYATDPDGYTAGWLAGRCKADPDCHATFLEHLEAMADHVESLDMPGKAAWLGDRIRDHAYADPRKEYTDEKFEDEITCLQEWSAQRPQEIRDYVAATR